MAKTTTRAAAPRTPRKATQPKTTEAPAPEITEEPELTAEAIAAELSGGDPDTEAGLLAALANGKDDQEEEEEEEEGEEEEEPSTSGPAYGRTKFSQFRHLLQPTDGIAFRTLCGGDVSVVFRPGQAAKMKQCDRCTKKAETITPVAEDEVDYSAEPFRLKSYTASPAEDAAPPKARSTRKAAPAPEVKTEEEGEGEKPAAPTTPAILEGRKNQSPAVLKKFANVTAAQVLAWILEQDDTAIDGRTKNRWRRNLERHGIALKGLTAADEKTNQKATLGWKVAQLDSPEAVAANLAKFPKYWAKLDKSTLKGYERNLFRAWDAYIAAHS